MGQWVNESRVQSREWRLYHTSSFIHHHFEGFTFIELLVVITIIGILAATLMPVFAKAREKGRQATCNSNLKQIGHAFSIYRADYDGWNPLAKFGGKLSNVPDGDYYWAPFDDTANPLNGPPGAGLVEGALSPYVKNDQIFRCPSVPDWQLGYGANTAGGTNDNGWKHPMGAPEWVVEAAADTLLVWDHKSNNPPICGTENGAQPPRHHQGAARHNEGLNMLWFDGHVKWMKPSQLKPDMFFVSKTNVPPHDDWF